jgi:histidinol-phosphatase (PHP family)
MPTPIYYDSHMHTPLCKHADGEPGEYAEHGYATGLKGIVFTCHNPIPGGYAAGSRMDIAELGDYVAMVRDAAEAWADRLDVRLGIESDYVPEMEPWLREFHNMADFQYIIGSVHPQMSEYLQRYSGDSHVALQGHYFEHLAMAAESGHFDCISHPDLIKNMIPLKWDVEAAMEHVRPCLDRIAATGVAMELNTSGYYKVIPEMNPGPEMLAQMRQRDIPVVISSDSHQPQRVGDRFGAALELLAATGYTQVSYFIERRRHDVDIAAVVASLGLA